MAATGLGLPVVAGVDPGAVMAGAVATGLLAGAVRLVVELAAHMVAALVGQNLAWAEQEQDSETLVETHRT